MGPIQEPIREVPLQLLTQFQEVAMRVAGGSLSAETVAATLQALIEKRPLESSSLGAKVIDICEGVPITEAFLAQTMTYNGQLYKRHRNGGGWVPAEQAEHDADRLKSFVAESAYVGPFAMVYDAGRVLDTAEVRDRGRVGGNAQISDGAQVRGNAHVRSAAQVSEEAVVDGFALVLGNARISGHVSVKATSMVYGNAQISGHVEIGGDAHVGGDTVLAGSEQILTGRLQ